MSLTRFLKDVGRPVAYYPKLARMLGSVNAAVFVCQLLYWADDRTKDPEGWIYKTQAEVEEETGLTRRKQETVRAALKERGILEEMRRGSHGTLHFRINTARLDALWSEWLKTPMHESANDQCTKAPNANGEKRHSINKDSETTAESTSETTGREFAPANFLPEWLDPKAWARWVAHRTEIKHPITLQQAQAQFRKLDEFRGRGMPAEKVIEQSIAHGWQGLFPLKPEQTNGQPTDNRPRTAYGGRAPVTRNFDKYPARAGR